jgi:hypothetical protein
MNWIVWDQQEAGYMSKSGAFCRLFKEAGTGDYKPSICIDAVVRPYQMLYLLHLY